MATVSQRPAEAFTESADPNSFGRRAEVGPAALLTLRLSPEMNQAVEELMSRTSLPKADVFNVAIGLLRAAVDAADRGKRIGIASDDAELEVEFTGF